MVGGTLVGPPEVRAQEARDTLPGVRLGLLYEAAPAPVLAFQPFTGRFGGQALGPRVQAIMARDLRYSNRFEILDELPSALLGPGVDYSLWDQLNVTWLVTGRVEGAGEGYVLLLEVHDVVFGEVLERARFPLPPRENDDFRMSVHAASDAVVEWIFDEPGMAASRIVFARQSTGADGRRTSDLWTVDSDGENLRRLTRFGDITLSPAWSPDGSRVAFMSYKSGVPRIYEMDLETGEEKSVDSGRPGQMITPAYHPDGRTLAFAVTGGNRGGIFTYDVERDCCLTNLTEGRWEDLSPTYSPDGNWLAFNSNRLGVGTPQIYVMPARGGTPDLVSPYVYGQGGYFTSPDWSPTGDRIVFHGRVESGRYHILVADREGQGRRVLQLTAEGNNEDPSWAPDGRHIVFVGERSWGTGLFVVDAVTGRTRQLVSGIRARLPDWSRSLTPAWQGALSENEE